MRAFSMLRSMALMAATMVAFSSAALAAQTDYNAWEAAPPGYVNWPSLPLTTQTVQAPATVRTDAGQGVAMDPAPMDLPIGPGNPYDKDPPPLP